MNQKENKHTKWQSIMLENCAVNHNMHFYQHIVCMDGFTLSVQAGEGLYCEPKESPYDEEGRWRKDFGYKSVEIMRKSKYWDEPLFDKYTSKGCHNCGSDRQGYAELNDPLEYVPVEVLAEVIKKHGGAIQGSIPPFHKEWQNKFYKNLKKEDDDLPFKPHPVPNTEDK